MIQWHKYTIFYSIFLCNYCFFVVVDNFEQNLGDIFGQLGDHGCGNASVRASPVELLANVFQDTEFLVAQCCELITLVDVNAIALLNAFENGSWLFLLRGMHCEKQYESQFLEIDASVTLLL